jgi:rubredoxin
MTQKICLEDQLFKMFQQNLAERWTDSLNEFAHNHGGHGGDYLKALASAWYNDTFTTGSLQKGIKTKQDVERLLQRGIVCPDGKTRKYNIDYNANFDGVDIYSDDYYEHGDHDDTIDSRTGQKWGPYEFITFHDSQLDEGWSQKYKKSINCSHPKGFSQKAHCAGKKKHNEDITMEAVCPDCGMCKTHSNMSLNEIKKGQKDSNGFTKCWPGKHAEGTKKGRNGGQVRNCVPNESQGVAEGADQVKKVFKDKFGKPVGEIGIDPESSPGNGEW